MKNLKKALAMFLAMLMILAVSPTAVFAAEDDTDPGMTEETPEEPEVTTPEAAWYTSFNLKAGEGTFSEAAERVVKGGKIVLFSDVTVTETVNFETSATIDGAGFTVKRGDDFDGVMFTVKENARLSFTNVTVDGNAEAHENGTDSVMHIYDGDVFLDENAVIRNNKTAENGTIVVGFGNDFTKEESSFTMKTGATIEDCIALSGGAAYVSCNSIFNMRGGAIKNCMVADNGGAVALAKDGASLSILEGEITDCSASCGSAVFAADKTKATITNGVISGNTNNSDKGAVYIANGAKLTVGGNVRITGNSGSKAQSNVYLERNVVMSVNPSFGTDARIGVTVAGFSAARPNLDFISYNGDVSGVLFNDADNRTFFKSGNTVTLELSITVVFDAGNGTCPIASKIYAVDKTFGTLPNPDERDGFDFLGWYTDNDILVTENSIVPDDDLTLHAKWENLNQLDMNPFAVIGRFFERIGDMLRMVFQFLNDLFTGSGDKHIEDLK